MCITLLFLHTIYFYYWSEKSEVCVVVFLTTPDRSEADMKFPVVIFLGSIQFLFYSLLVQGSVDGLSVSSSSFRSTYFESYCVFTSIIEYFNNPLNVLMKVHTTHPMFKSIIAYNSIIATYYNYRHYAVNPFYAIYTQLWHSDDYLATEYGGSESFFLEVFSEFVEVLVHRFYLNFGIFLDLLPPDVLIASNLHLNFEIQLFRSRKTSLATIGKYISHVAMNYCERVNFRVLLFFLTTILQKPTLDCPEDCVPFFVNLLQLSLDLQLPPYSSVEEFSKFPPMKKEIMAYLLYYRIVMNLTKHIPYFNLLLHSYLGVFFDFVKSFGLTRDENFKVLVEQYDEYESHKSDNILSAIFTKLNFSLRAFLTFIATQDRLSEPSNTYYLSYIQLNYLELNSNQAIRYLSF